MRIIFLDIDGVLNHLGCKEKAPSGVYFVEDGKILLLKEIIAKTDAKIVLSSTWRSGWKDFKEGKINADSLDFVALQNKLKEFNIELYDYTPLSEKRNRGNEILEWVENHLDEIDSMLILDDDSDIKPFGHFFLRTSFTEGLKPSHYKRAIEMLLKDDFKEWYNKQKKEA